MKLKPIYEMAIKRELFYEKINDRSDSIIIHLTRLRCAPSVAIDSVSHWICELTSKFIEITENKIRDNLTVDLNRIYEEVGLNEFENTKEYKNWLIKKSSRKESYIITEINNVQFKDIRDTLEQYAKIIYEQVPYIKRKSLSNKIEDLCLELVTHNENFSDLLEK